MLPSGTYVLPHPNPSPREGLVTRNVNWYPPDLKGLGPQARFARSDDFPAATFSSASTIVYSIKRSTLIGRPAPWYCVSSITVSPVGTKPHFSITRPLAGLSMKCPDIRDLMSVIHRICSIISPNASVQMPLFQYGLAIQ